MPTRDGKANTDGVQMDEINWMQQNINAAQDASEKLQNTAKEIEKLKADPQKLKDYIKNVLNKDENTPLTSLSQDDHNKLAEAASYDSDTQALRDAKLDPDTMTPEQRSKALYDLQPNIHTPLDDLFGALGTIGGGLLGSLGLALGRRREDEEGGEAERDNKLDGDKDRIPVPETPNEPERKPEAQVYPALNIPKDDVILSAENQKIKDLEAAVQKRRDELDKASFVADGNSDNQQSYSRTFTLAEKNLNDSIKALEKAKQNQTERILKTEDGQKIAGDLSNARYALDSILRSIEFKTQTDALNSALVAKNVIENQLKKFNDEKRPSNDPEVVSWKNSLKETEKTLSNAQANLDKMTKKARTDVDSAKKKLETFVNKARLEENTKVKNAKYSNVEAYLDDKHRDEFNDKKALLEVLNETGVSKEKYDSISSLIGKRDELKNSLEKESITRQNEASIQLALSSSEKLKSIDSELQAMNKAKEELQQTNKVKLFLTDSDIKQAHDLDAKIDKLNNDRINESFKIINDLKLTDKPSIKTVDAIEKLANLETRIKKEIYELGVQNILSNNLTSDGSNKFTGSLEYLNKPDPTDSRIQDNLVSKVVGLDNEGMPSQTLALKASESIKIPTLKGKETMDESVFKRAVDSVWEKPSTPDPVNAEKKKELLVLRDRIDNANSDTERKNFQHEFDIKNSEFMKTDPATQATLNRNDPAIVNQGANKGMSVQTAVVIQAIRDME